MVNLEQVALGFALAEVDNEVREEGGNNRGPRIKKYLANTDPPINVAAPWCAAFIQYVSDRSAHHCGIKNPLDDVKLEAYVQSYHQWAEDHGKIVGRSVAAPGDLILFNFGGQRWDHIGMVVKPPEPGGFVLTVEGNTGDESDRDGDGVFVKGRKTNASYPVEFVRWAA